MQELTLILFVACLAVGGAVMFVKKAPSGARMLALVLSVLSIGAVLTDDSVAASEGYELTLMIVAPFVVFVWSLMTSLFGEAKRWRGGARPPIYTGSRQPSTSSPPTLPSPRAWASSPSSTARSWR